MNSSPFKGSKIRNFFLPALIVALWVAPAPALGADAAPVGEPLPQKLMGIWQITAVRSDAVSYHVHKFEPDDPRLMGGILHISPQRMMAKADGENPSCKNPTMTVQKITAGQLLKDTMAERPESPAHPTPRDYGLPFDPNEQLTIMWVKGFGRWDDLLDFDGTYMFAMPDGRLAMRWRNSSIILLSHAPADIRPPASFDCAKAHSDVEKTICGSVELSLLDSEVSASCSTGSLLNRATTERDKRYFVALKQYQNEQKAWLKQRDACGNDPKCLKNAMIARIDSLSAFEFPNYSFDSWAEFEALAMAHAADGGPPPAAEPAPAAKPLPEKLLGIWRVTGVLTDAGSHWYCDFVNNDPRLMGGVMLVTPQRILAKAGEETVSCTKPMMSVQTFTAGRLIKETMGRRPSKVTMDGRDLIPPMDPTPNDYGFAFAPDAPLTVMWVKDFDGYWQPLNANGTWLLEMPDGRLAMRWHYAAILLFSRAPAAHLAEMAHSLAAFDCAKARTAVEKSICGSLELSLLDSYLSEWYGGCLAILPRKASALYDDTYLDELKTVKKEQKAWIRQRETCGSNSNCLKKSMNARADALAARFSKLHPVLSVKE